MRSQRTQQHPRLNSVRISLSRPLRIVPPCMLSRLASSRLFPFPSVLPLPLSLLLPSLSVCCYLTSAPGGRPLVASTRRTPRTPPLPPFAAVSHSRMRTACVSPVALLFSHLPCPPPSLHLSVCLFPSFDIRAAAPLRVRPPLPPQPAQLFSRVLCGEMPVAVVRSSSLSRPLLASSLRCTLLCKYSRHSRSSKPDRRPSKATADSHTLVGSYTDQQSLEPPLSDPSFLRLSGRRMVMFSAALIAVLLSVVPALAVLPIYLLLFLGYIRMC